MNEVKYLQKVNYQNKQGRQVVGTRLGLEFEDEKWLNGKAIEVVYVSGNKADHVQVGDWVKVNYNRYGSVEDITIVE